MSSFHTHFVFLGALRVREIIRFFGDPLLKVTAPRATVPAAAMNSLLGKRRRKMNTFSWFLMRIYSDFTFNY